MNASSQNMMTKGFQYKKVYKNWKGKNYFCCRGFLYVGPEYYYGVFTNMYIQVYGWLFIAFVLIVILY